MVEAIICRGGSLVVVVGTIIFFAAAIEGGIPPPGQFYYEFFYTAFQTQQVNVIIFKEWFNGLPFIKMI